MSNERKETGGNGAPSRSKKKILGLVVIFVMTLIGGVVGSLFLPERLTEVLQEEIASVHSLFKKEPIAVVIPMESFMTNIQTKDGRGRMMRMNVSIEVTGEDNQQAVADKEMALRDAVLTVVRNQTVEVIREQEGIDHFKEELKESFNQTLNDTTIDQVYITDLIIQ